VLFLEREHDKIVAAGIDETTGVQGGLTIGGAEGAAGRAILGEEVVGEPGGEEQLAISAEEKDGAVEGGGELGFRIEPEGNFGFETGVLEFEGSAGGAEFELNANAADEFGDVDGFGDVVDGAGGEGADFLIGRIDRGEENDRQGGGGRSRAKRGANRETILPGHDDIEEDQVGGAAGEDIAGSGATIGEEDPDAFAPQSVANYAETGGSVVDDENGGGVHERNCEGREWLLRTDGAVAGLLEQGAKARELETRGGFVEGGADRGGVGVGGADLGKGGAEGFQVALGQNIPQVGADGGGQR
jgi:hypothetical protein